MRTSADGTPLLVKHIAQVRVGAALRHGVITRDGEGEAVTGIVMMLIGANSRDVVRADEIDVVAVFEVRRLVRDAAAPREVGRQQDFAVHEKR